MDISPTPESGFPDPLAQLEAIVEAEAGRLGIEGADMAETEVQAPAADPEDVVAFVGRLADAGELATHPDVSAAERDALFEEIRIGAALLGQVVTAFRAENPPTTILAPHERIAPSGNMHPVARAEFDQLRD
jgi:hypothetical protein